MLIAHHSSIYRTYREIIFSTLLYRSLNFPQEIFFPVSYVPARARQEVLARSGLGQLRHRSRQPCIEQVVKKKWARRAAVCVVVKREKR